MERMLANIGWMIHYLGQSANDTISGNGSYCAGDENVT